MKTTTFKAMMAIAFATIAMTANANPKGKTWRDAAPAPKMEVRHDNRNNRHFEADWRHCRHNHTDRFGNRTFCHNCGAEMIWKGDRRHGYYEAIAPRPEMNAFNHGGAPVPPPPATGNKNNPPRR